MSGLCPSVPFIFPKEQVAHLGQGSRRWCRAALGETDRQGSEGLPPGLQGPEAGSRGSDPLERGWLSQGLPPTRSGPYSLAVVEGKCAGRREEPRGLIFTVLLQTLNPPCLTPGMCQVTLLGPGQGWVWWGQGRTGLLAPLQGCSLPAGQRLHQGPHPGTTLPPRHTQAHITPQGPQGQDEYPAHCWVSSTSTQ